MQTKNFIVILLVVVVSISCFYVIYQNGLKTSYAKGISEGKILGYVEGSINATNFNAHLSEKSYLAGYKDGFAAGQNSTSP